MIFFLPGLDPLTTSTMRSSVFSPPHLLFPVALILTTNLALAVSSSRLDFRTHQRVNPNCLLFSSAGEAFNLQLAVEASKHRLFNVTDAGVEAFSYLYEPCRPFVPGDDPMSSNMGKFLAWQIIRPFGVSKGIYEPIGRDPKLLEVDEDGRRDYYVEMTAGFRRTVVKLVCDPSTGVRGEPWFVSWGENPRNVYNFELGHLCACANGCPVITPEMTFKVLVFSAVTAVIIIIIIVIYRLNRKGDCSGGGRGLDSINESVASKESWFSSAVREDAVSLVNSEGDAKTEKTYDSV